MVVDRAAGVAGKVTSRWLRVKMKATRGQWVKKEQIFLTAIGFAESIDLAGEEDGSGRGPRRVGAKA